MMSLLIMQIFSAAALVAAQGPGSSVGILAPGVNYSSAALQVYSDAAQASKSNPNSSWEVYWNPNIANFTRFIIWDTVISDIPAPVPISDLGQPNANYTERLNFTNTQVQLWWDTERQNDVAGSFGDSSLQEILQGANTTLDVDIFTAYLPASALSDYVNLANGYCSWLSPECRDELAAAARRSAPLPSAGLGTGSLPNCAEQLGDVTAVHIGKSIYHLISITIVDVTWKFIADLASLFLRLQTFEHKRPERQWGAVLLRRHSLLPRLHYLR
jgi:hypothetical protein